MALYSDALPKVEYFGYHISKENIVIWYKYSIENFIEK